jgi:hypothetical protein
MRKRKRGGVAIRHYKFILFWAVAEHTHTPFWLQLFSVDDAEQMKRFFSATLHSLLLSSAQINFQALWTGKWASLQFITTVLSVYAPEMRNLKEFDIMQRSRRLLEADFTPFFYRWKTDRRKNPHRNHKVYIISQYPHFTLCGFAFFRRGW